MAERQSLLLKQENRRKSKSKSIKNRTKNRGYRSETSSLKFNNQKRRLSGDYPHCTRAFYSALAEHDHAVEVMGSDELKIIAAELFKALLFKAAVDWHKRDNVRSKMRSEVKKILRRFGYPPDLSDFAVRNVQAQAEVFLDENA